MTSFLKGNYDLPDKEGASTSEGSKSKNLTDKFEDSVLAKLGGSICFVSKGKTLLWAGDEDEQSSI